MACERGAPDHHSKPHSVRGKDGRGSSLVFSFAVAVCAGDLLQSWISQAFIPLLYITCNHRKETVWWDMMDATKQSSLPHKCRDIGLS